MKRTVIMRDKDLIAFLNKERKNPLFTSIEVEPVTYQELQHEILVDQIKNPVIRLVDLLSMLTKFEKLSKLDWHDLYLLEQDTLEYNYDWYRSRKYLEQLKLTATQ